MRSEERSVDGKVSGRLGDAVVYALCLASPAAVATVRKVALRLRTVLPTRLSLQAARTAKQKRTLISAPLSKGNMIRVCLVQEDQKQMERCLYVKVVREQRRKNRLQIIF